MTRFALCCLVATACGSTIDATPDAPPIDMPEPLPPPPPDPVVAPSNGDSVGPLEPTGLVLTTPNGSFDTDAHCTTPSILGRCEPVATFDLDLCICRVDRLSIGDLEVHGRRALVVLAYETIIVAGRLIVEPNPDCRAYSAPQTERLGGAGGSYGGIGGNHGAPMFGSITLEPLHGGMAGQDACNARGGAAGSAIQLTAGETISVPGSIEAGGGGGKAGGSGSYCVGGAGGGSGGAILIEAPEVVVAGTIAANGGGGGGGSTSGGPAGDPGAQGSLEGDAFGGAGESGHGCLALGYTGGGGGGSGSAGSDGRDGGPYDQVTGCFFSPIILGQGGGGGGSGRVRINSDQPCACDGTLMPLPTFGPIVRH